MDVHYVTSNLRKFQEAAYILKTYPAWNVKHLPLDLEEIQGQPSEIVHHKAQLALAQVKAPLIVEDVSFACPALGGLPGPYIKHFLHALKPEGLAELVHKASPKHTTSHPVEVSCHVAYIAPGQEPIYAVGSMQGQVVAFKDPSGRHPMSWNSIYIQEGQVRRFSEMSIDEICQISMRKAALTLLFERVSHVGA